MKMCINSFPTIITPILLFILMGSPLIAQNQYAALKAFLPAAVDSQSFALLKQLAIETGRSTQTAAPENSRVFNIWKIPAGLTRDAINLTRFEDNCLMPRFSPDGKWIAFIRGAPGAENLWMMTARGKNKTRLTDDNAGAVSPVWDPNGKQLAFARMDRILIFNPFEKRIIRNFQPGNMQLIPCAWSNDDVLLLLERKSGKMYKFVLSGNAGQLQPIATDEPTLFHIWTDMRMRPDAGAAAYETVDETTGNIVIYLRDFQADEDWPLSEIFARDRDPDFSPDGRSIIFSSNLPLPESRLQSKVVK